jgi:5'(3')-deoxyribonucleotidase
MIRDESFFDCLEVIADAQQVIRELADKHEVFIVSAAMEIPESFATKYRWLRRNFPFISPRNIVFCGDKRIVNADYLIDDEARHVSSFRGNGILFSAPHNLRETAYERVANWQDIRRKLLEPPNNSDLNEAEPVLQFAVHERNREIGSGSGDRSFCTSKCWWQRSRKLCSKETSL